MSSTDGEAIKGAALKEFLAWYGETRGEQEVHRVVDALPADARKWFDPDREAMGVLANAWYPAPAIHALLDRMTDGMGPAERDRFALDGSVAVMEKTLSGLYRTLFNILATPDRYAKFAPKVWAHYYRSGTFRIDEHAPGHHVAQVRDWNTHHPALCDMNRGAAVAIYGNMKLEDLKVTRDACIDDGDPECRFVIRWKA